MDALKAVFFDFSGTLFHHEHLHDTVIRQVFSEYSPEVVDEDELRAYMHLPYRDRFIQLLTMRGIDDDALVDQLTERAHAAFEQVSGIQHALLPGAREFMQHLSERGILMAVVSSMPHAVIEENLVAARVREHVSVITGSDDVSIRKPHPEPYEQTLAECGLQAAEVVAFEDTPTGIESARLAGIPVIGLLTTYPAEELHHAVWTIRDYRKLTIETVMTHL